MTPEGRQDDDAKANPNPGPSVVHDFGCNFDPCRCAPEGRHDVAEALAPWHKPGCYHLAWKHITPKAANVGCDCGLHAAIDAALPTPERSGTVGLSESERQEGLELLAAAAEGPIVFAVNNLPRLLSSSSSGETEALGRYIDDGSDCACPPPEHRSYCRYANRSVRTEAGREEP